MRLLLAFLLTVCSLAACGEDEAAEERAPRPARVAAGVARDGALTVEWRFFGRARALNAATLAAGEDGQVQEVRVRVGDHVAQGDRLVDIDPRIARAQLRSAREQRESTVRQLDQARRDAERLASAGAEVVSAVEIEQARSRMDVLEAELARSNAGAGEVRASLSRHRMDAPFAGVISERLVDPGDWVAPGTPMLTLVAEEGVEVLVEAPPEAGERLQVGDAATLIRGTERVPASVLGIVRALDPATRTMSIRLGPTVAPAWLVPGIDVRVEFEVEQRSEGAVVVSRDAIVEGAASRRRVVRITDGTAELVQVTIVADGGDQVLVRSEGDLVLVDGDPIVVRGNERLRAGQALEVLESAEDGAEGSSSEGSSSEGSSSEGSSAEGSSEEGSSAEGSSAEGSSAEGSSAEGSSAEGSSAEGGSAEGSSAEDSASDD